MAEDWIQKRDFEKRKKSRSATKMEARVTKRTVLVIKPKKMILKNR